MLNKLLVALFLSLGSSSLFAQYEEEAIKEVILEAYVNGVYNEGVLRNIKLGFSEKFQAFEIDKDGNMSVQNLEEWKAEVHERIIDGKYPVSGTEKVSLRYHNVDIFRNMAHVKITFLIGNQTYAREVLTLYQSPKGWLILNKTFQKQSSSKTD